LTHYRVLFFAILLGSTVTLADAAPLPARPQAKRLAAGDCQPVPNVEGMNLDKLGLEHSLSPVASATNVLWELEVEFKPHTDREREKLRALEKSATFTILQQPKYGKLSTTTSLFPEPEKDLLFYVPQAGYMGKDQIVFLVEMGDYTIKLFKNLYMIDGATGAYWDKKICGKRGKIYRVAE
jgi:hypothetical protein